MESLRSLGYDFWFVGVAVKGASSFEGISHFRHCYYREKDLGGCNNLSPSPLGKLAIFQESSSGQIFLFDTSSGKSTQLTRMFPGVMSSAAWQVETSSVTIYLYGTHPPVSLKYAEQVGT